MKPRGNSSCSDAIPDLEGKIFTARGYKVMLDSDLAKLYGVPTKRMVEAVKRNIHRFPVDFMFALNGAELRELTSLRSQIATSKSGRGGRRYLPFVFTEQGVAMLSSVLNSKRAIEVNIVIMRAFVRMRALTSTHLELALKVLEHEAKLIRHDRTLVEIFDAIRQLREIPPPSHGKPRIGF